MSEPFVLNGRSGGGFSRDLRFVPAGAISSQTVAVEVVDPIATAFAEGFAAGSNEALEAAETAALNAAQAREKLNASFVKLDAELAETLRHKLLETVTALCESVLHPLALDTEALARRIETAVAMFSRADDERVVRLHPDDLDLLAGTLPADWQFSPDASLERGALRIETASGGVEDGPAQWRAAITEALRLC
jgi:flagellar assembly protein FliH